MQYPPMVVPPHLSLRKVKNNRPIRFSRTKIFLFSFLFIFLLSTYFLFPLYQKVWIKLFSPTFSIIVLPDTQVYAADNPEFFCKQTQWIVDNMKSKNIVFVSHVGDIVGGWKFKTKEWEAASKCMGILDGRIPYSIVPGNHDTETGSRDSGLTTYNAYFPTSRYSNNAWYKGNRKENANSYQMLKIWGIEFLFLSLEVEPSNNSVAWGKDIVQRYPHAYAALTTHKYLPDNGNSRDKNREYSAEGNTGEDIWKKLVKDSCSIRLVWSGHFHANDGEALLTSTNTCGYKVYQTTQNYQSREKGGNGKLRIYTFNPNKKEIRVQTYSPVTNTFEIDASSEFTIPFLFEFEDSWWRIKP